jgi:ABC-type nitrate/sulfonate/bicarbonate transport system substrate-binding protein
MKEKEKEAVAAMLKASQETLDTIRELIKENAEIPEDVKNKALKNLEKTKNKVKKTISKESGNHGNFPSEI